MAAEYPTHVELKDVPFWPCDVCTRKFAEEKNERN